MVTKDEPAAEPEELDVSITSEVEQETSRALGKETRQVLFAVLLVAAFMALAHFTGLKSWITNVQIWKEMVRHFGWGAHAIFMVAARRLEADSLNPNDPVLKIPATMNDTSMTQEDAVYSVRELYDALPLVQAAVLDDVLAMVPNIVRQSLPKTMEEIEALLSRYPEYFACWPYPDDPAVLVVQRAKLVTNDIPKEDLLRAVLPLIPQGGLSSEKLMRRVPLPVQRYFYKYGLETTLTLHLCDFVLVVVNHKVMKIC